jgi:uncharacterized protein (DUF952 family)
MYNDKIIYHIVTLTEWELQKNNPTYIHTSLANEGFIHCSTANQLVATINRYYANEKSVFVLHIDIEKLNPELKYELAPSVNQLFPHIFGEINREAIIKVEETQV